MINRSKRPLPAMSKLTYKGHERCARALWW